LFPAVAILTICAPEGGIAAMRTIAVIFAVCEVWASLLFIHILQHAFDRISRAAVGGVVLTAVMMAILLYGLLPPTPSFYTTPVQSNSR
jgi:hypothetical protein